MYSKFEHSLSKSDNKAAKTAFELFFNYTECVKDPEASKEALINLRTEISKYSHWSITALQGFIDHIVIHGEREFRLCLEKLSVTAGLPLAEVNFLLTDLIPVEPKPIKATLFYEIGNLPLIPTHQPLGSEVILYPS